MIKTTVNEEQITNKSPKNSKKVSNQSNPVYYCQPSKAKLVQDKEKKNMYTFVSTSNDQDESENKKHDQVLKKAKSSSIFK